ncbi:oligosaccharide flippase family protein [Gaetbulibacter sp. M240]|uniref:lipopolysaccharide biosynthesis protein n=1 Tax=Gaetbulibacter sp. M240 TaxID=3126511 RepID=UPI00374F0D3D
MYKTVIKNTFFYGLATVVPKIINFLLVKVHTDSLNVSDYAVNTDFYIWISLFAILLTFGVETSFFRFYNDENDKSKLIGTTFITTVCSVILLGIFFCLFENFLLEIFDFTGNSFRIKILFGVLAFDTLSTIPFAYLRIKNNASLYAIIRFVNVIIVVGLNLFFLKFLPEFIDSYRKLPSIFTENFYKVNLVDYIFIANLIGSGVSFLLLLPYLIKFKFYFDLTLLKRIIKYGWPIVIAGMAYIINENMDKFLIKRLVGGSEMGIYSACYKLSIFMNLYVMAFRLGIEPFFFNVYANKNAKAIYSKIMTYFVIIGSLILFAIVALVDVFKNFINPNYWDALIIVPIVLLANLFSGIYQNLSIWYKLINKTYFGMCFSLIGATITVFLNLLLLPIFGFIVSAWVTLIVYFVMTLLSYRYGKKYYKITYNIRKINLYLITSIILSIISFCYFRNNIFVSISLILFFIIFTIINERKELMILLNKY